MFRRELGLRSHLHIMRSLFAPIALLIPCSVLADFTGRVIAIVDGDTLTVLLDKKPIHVRLEGIDAPERGQPYGDRSRHSLAQLCASKSALVEARGKDRYGRTIARITCDDVSANYEQLRRGMAWVFVRYVPVRSPLYELEAYAKQLRLGLWADPQPIAPWSWRATQGKRVDTKGSATSR